MILNVLLPDGASLDRTDAVLDELRTKVAKIDGIENIIAIDGISLMDNNASLSNSGILYVMFKDWGERGKDASLPELYKKLNDIAASTLSAKVMVVVPPPIQGLGLSGGFQMQLEVQDGSFDYQKLQVVTDQLIDKGTFYPEIAKLMTSFRAFVPQILAPIDRTKAETLGVSLSDAFGTLQTYLGSSYVNLFTKFGQVFQVYVQAEAKSRMTIDDLRYFYVKNKSGDMVPLGTLTDIKRDLGPAIISLYNLYPSSSINGISGQGYSSGQSIAKLEQLANDNLPPGVGYEWTSTAYQEKVAGNMSYYIFLLSLVLVYLILAGQYENWLTPAAILLSVPLALIGTVLALKALGLANNMYTQIGILLLIALAAKNAILIVEVAREHRLIDKKSIIESAVLGAKTRFRPIMMTSFAFIMGVLPLVFATGAGASARKSIGIAVCSGMLASTCLAVVFVPVLIQTWQENRQNKKYEGKVSEVIN